MFSSSEVSTFSIQKQNIIFTESASPCQSETFLFGSVYYKKQNRPGENEKCIIIEKDTNSKVENESQKVTVKMKICVIPYLRVCFD